MSSLVLPLLRGSAEGAECAVCPLAAIDGGPNRPVFSEHPEDPAWILIGESPGHNESRLGKPFVGLSGMEVNKLLGRIGRPRDQIAVVNAVLCQPPMGAPVELREQAARCCAPRLQRELAQWPGKPVLTLGAVAARAVIPKARLDAIDPPDVPKSKKRAQKEKKRKQIKIDHKRETAINRTTQQFLHKRLKEWMDAHKREIIRRHNRKPDRKYLEKMAQQVRGAIAVKCRKDAEQLYELRLKERAAAKLTKAATKPRKKKPIKITDIASTTFRVDVDGTGERVLIPAIHPAALLRGGGATIGGTHTPDLAFINLLFDFGKIDSVAKGKDIWLDFNIEIEVIDADNANRLAMGLLCEALDGGGFGLDLETYVDDPERHHALMAYVAKISTLGLATKARAVSVKWDLLTPLTRELLQITLARCVTTYHNGLYDKTVLRAHGFILDDTCAFDDSLLAHHAAFPGCAHRLQQVTSQFYGVEPWKAEFRNHNADSSEEDLARYCAKDTASTVANMAPLTIWIKRTGTERVYARDRAMAEIASRMHLDGMPVSREVNAELMNRFSTLALESRRKVEDTARQPRLREHILHHLALAQAGKQRKKDPPDFEKRYELRFAALKDDPDWHWKIGSSKHISALLQGLGVALTQVTATGQISTKKDVLEALTDVPIVRDIIANRENEKMYGTFVAPIFDRTAGGQLIPGFADDSDRVHPIWSVHKISGRWASAEPVVSNKPREKWKRILDLATIINKLGWQQLEDGVELWRGPGMVEIKRVTKDGKIVSADILDRPTPKRQFITRRGRVLVGFDFSQLEARIIALISGDPFLLWVFSTGRDIHTECARIIFSTFDSLSKQQQKQCRNETKPLEYGAFYGGSVETLWKQLLKEGRNVKLVDVAASVMKLMAKMAGVVKWQRDTVLRASTPPFELRDFVDGRRRVWPMGQVEATEALNIVPQSTGAAIMNTGMERMAVRLLKYKQAFPIEQIHDSSAFECWESDAEAIKRDVDECFPQEYTRDGVTIPFPIESSIATCLADL